MPKIINNLLIPVELVKVDDTKPGAGTNRSSYHREEDNQQNREQEPGMAYPTITTALLQTSNLEPCLMALAIPSGIETGR